VGADIKSLRNRIKSIDSTLHLTKAMGLVASSKMKRALDGKAKSTEYKQSLEKTIRVLLQSSDCKNSVYFQGNGKIATALIVIAGDRGLAGGYNANVFRLEKTFGNAVRYAIGKRACDRLSTPYISAEKFSYSDAKILADKLLSDYQSGDIGKVAIISTKYNSMISQEAVLEWVLPFDIEPSSDGAGVIFEPDEKTVLDAVIPEYLASVIVQKVRESFACEIVARRTAMDSAGKNATQMIEDLQLEYNRARQGAITQEITEIVAGSEV